MKLAGALSAIVILMVTAGEGRTQGSIGDSLNDIGLTRDDYQLLAQEAASLYMAASPQVGDKGEWANQETKSHGTVTISEVEENCVSLAHLFRVGSTKKVYEFSSRRCRNEDGEWLLAPK